MKKQVLTLSLLMSISAAATSEVRELEAKGLKQVVVENISGKVSVLKTEAAKATVSVNKNVFSNKCSLTIDKVNDKLVVKVERSKGLFSSENCDADFEVKVPKSMDLDLTVGSGSLDVRGIQGALVFKLGSGNLNAEGIFSSLNGKSGSGTVSVQGLTGGGELKSGSGAISLGFVAPLSKGELDIKSGAGDATLTFPKGMKVKTKFAAGSGLVTNELAATAEADFSVAMKAGSGDLKIKASK